MLMCFLLFGGVCVGVCVCGCFCVRAKNLWENVLNMRSHRFKRYLFAGVFLWVYVRALVSALPGACPHHYWKVDLLRKCA